MDKTACSDCKIWPVVATAERLLDRVEQEVPGYPRPTLEARKNLLTLRRLAIETTFEETECPRQGNETEIALGEKLCARSSGAVENFALGDEQSILDAAFSMMNDKKQLGY